MATLGTLLKTWLKGIRVGEDSFGNKYYRSKNLDNYGRAKRWVVYNGQPEASKVPPEWHAWLHYMVEDPLLDKVRYDWQKDHLPNLTGTGASYAADGSVHRDGNRWACVGDYDAWTPN